MVDPEQSLDGTQTEAIVYRSAVKALLAALAPRFDDTLRARLAACGLDDEALRAGCFHDSWVKALEISAAYCNPDLPEDEALFELGRRFVTRYGDSMAGKAVLMAIRLMGPESAVRRMAEAFRAANSYTRTHARRVHEQEYELERSGVVKPSFVRGVLTAALEESGVETANVRLVSHAGQVALFRATWH